MRDSSERRIAYPHDFRRSALSFLDCEKKYKIIVIAIAAKKFGYFKIALNKKL
jgi:hypothetical protein